MLLVRADRELGGWVCRKEGEVGMGLRKISFRVSLVNVLTR